MLLAARGHLKEFSWEERQLPPATPPGLNKGADGGLLVSTPPGLSMGAERGVSFATPPEPSNEAEEQQALVAAPETDDIAQSSELYHAVYPINRPLMEPFGLYRYGESLTGQQAEEQLRVRPVT